MTVDVFANIGAEEGPRWRQAAEHPAARTLARAFVSVVEPRAFDWLPKGPGLYPWLATAEAEAEAQRRSMVLLGPSVAAVRRVHDKAFVHREVPGDDPASESFLVFDADELDDAVTVRDRVEQQLAAHPAWYRCGFVLKPRWGTSGRGRLSWSGKRGTSPREALGQRGLNKLRARCGAVLEPWLTRRQDFSIQLYVPPAGPPEVLATTRQDLRPAGVYLGNHGVIDDDGRPSAGGPDAARLLPGALRVAEAAHAAGFTGPCGVDAFLYTDPSGEEQLRAVVEINARATGGTILAARVTAAVRDGRAAPGDHFRYEAGADHLAITRA